MMNRIKELEKLQKDSEDKLHSEIEQLSTERQIPKNYSLTPRPNPSSYKPKLIDSSYNPYQVRVFI